MGLKKEIKSRHKRVKTFLPLGRFLANFIACSYMEEKGSQCHSSLSYSFSAYFHSDTADCGSGKVKKGKGQEKRGSFDIFNGK